MVLLCWFRAAVGHEAVSALEQREYVGQWYAWNDSGTYVVSGNRVVLFEGVKVPEELASRITGLIIGAGWKEGYLLFHEFFGRAVQSYIPESANILLRGVSQAWLIWTVYRSIADITGPLLKLASEYRQAWSQWEGDSGDQKNSDAIPDQSLGESWSGKRVKGVVPIPVNDIELSFRVFVRAVFPEGLDEPVAVEIDRIPSMPGLPSIVRPHIHANPWDKLISEMALEGINRVLIAGSSRGRLQLTYQDSHNNWREQLITASLDAEYEPVPWLLDMVRKGGAREDARLYASLLSHDVLDLASQMLSCRRLNPVISPDKPVYCTLGQLEALECSLHYQPYELLVPPQIWEDRNYPQGRVLPLSGCNFSDRPLCWENYLIWSNSSLIYPWPVMTLYSRFSDYAERTSWLLLSKEPQIWRTSSNFQIRVPELVTRLLLNLVSTVGQAAVNRLVTSLHHSWWQNGAEQGFAKRYQSRKISEEEGHYEAGDQPCDVCGTACQYPMCPLCLDRFESDTMVRICENEHRYCAECFFGMLDRKGINRCGYCDQVHRNRLNPVFYPDYELGDDDGPKYPTCPTCRDRIDYNKGNVNQFLQDECGTFRLWWKWLFSDDLKEPVKEGQEDMVLEPQQEPVAFDIAD